MRAGLEHALAELEDSLQQEAVLVRGALRDALRALHEQDVALADEVISADDAIDRLYVAVEDRVQTVLARQTPVAADLRLVLALLHVNLHLERMADHCVTVCKLTKVTHGLVPDPYVVEGFTDMSQRAEEMLTVAMRALAHRDRHLAESLVALDELIDRANRRVVNHVLDIGGDPSMREWGVRMIVVSRCLERFGDHAVDIGEQVAFLVTGEFREFTDASADAASVGP
jgi:phosphate transport system protein